MGSEQSHQHGHSHNASQQQRQHQQQHSLPPGAVALKEDGPEYRPDSTSPRPSICSDSDVPYISYTVNRPIGDSPKLPPKHFQRGKTPSPRVSPKPRQPKGKAHNIVVVKQAQETEGLDQDPELLRLQVNNEERKKTRFPSDSLSRLISRVRTNSSSFSIPPFLPIMRGTLNLPALRDPEVLERLDPTGSIQLGLRYEEHLRLSAESITSEQNQLAQRMREVDMVVTSLMSTLTDRQKKYAKHAEKLGKVREVSHSLTRCHMLLNETLESLETLNNLLPVEERLDPFVWTTG